MIALLLNSDEYLASQRIRQLKQAVGDAELADLNTEEVDGARTSGADLVGRASMVPFLTPRRLVIAHGYLSHLDRRMAQSHSTDSAAHLEASQLLTTLPTLPASGDLLFVEQAVDKRRQLWRGFTATKGGRIPGLADLITVGQIQLEELQTPDAKAIPGWIQRQARERQIAIDGRAIQLLATYVGPNLRQLDNELEKLATYAAGRTITGTDVQTLVSDASEALIWELTDALSQRSGRRAMQALCDLRRNSGSNANPFYLLSMIARQYRLMILVKDGQAAVGADANALAKHVGEKPYPVKKALEQSQRYSSAELDAIMAHLLETDYAAKSGTHPETAIDLLVAQLTSSPHAATEHG